VPTLITKSGLLHHEIGGELFITFHGPNAADLPKASRVPRPYRRMFSTTGMPTLSANALSAA